MTVFRSNYEQMIEKRNYTGIMLIDRNDELCILYEKSNIYEEVIRQGDIELTRKVDQSKMLDL